MLDVHPPHHTPNTWRDFFLHIATIVVGLLIAVGIEQTVEYLHHRHELKKAREELSAEREENRAILEKNLAAVKSIEAQLDQDMALLREHQRTQQPLAAPLDYSGTLYRTPDGVWQSVRETGALGLMPHDELHANVYLYEVFSSFMEAVHAFLMQAETAQAIAHRSPDPGPRDTEELITATSETQGRLAYAARFLGYEATGLKQAQR